MAFCMLCSTTAFIGREPCPACEGRPVGEVAAGAPLDNWAYDSSGGEAAEVRDDRSIDLGEGRETSIDVLYQRGGPSGVRGVIGRIAPLAAKGLPGYEDVGICWHCHTFHPEESAALESAPVDADVDALTRLRLSPRYAGT